MTTIVDYARELDVGLAMFEEIRKPPSVR